MTPTILHLDDHVIAIDKPSGLVVHRSAMARDHETCLSMVRRHTGRWVYPAHRLDRGTSGVLVFTTDPDSARTVRDSFVSREIQKQYLAIVRGHAPASGTIDHPFAGADDTAPVSAMTRFTRLAEAELPHAVGRYATARYSLVHVEPLTGRTHQIRRHLKHINHPVIGDTMHGDGRHNRFAREHFGVKRIMLHAWRLTLAHPHTGLPLELNAPVPQEFLSVFELLGWRT